MANLTVVYEGDADVVLDRFRPGQLEAALGAEVVTTSAKGILRDSSGRQVAAGGTDVAHGEYRFYPHETAGEQQSNARLHRPPYICSVVCFLQTAKTGPGVSGPTRSVPFCFLA